MIFYILRLLGEDDNLKINGESTSQVCTQKLLNIPVLVYVLQIQKGL